MDTNAMGSGPPGDDMGPESGTGGGIGQLLDFNALNYEMFPDLTVATERTYKNQFFTRNSYPGGQGTMVCIFNTGSDFIDGKESYLTFTLDYEAGVQNTIARTYGPNGSAINHFTNIVITDRAGNELERINNLDMLANRLLIYQNTQDWMKSTANSFYARNFASGNTSSGSAIADIGTAADYAGNLVETERVQDQMCIPTTCNFNDAPDITDSGDANVGTEGFSGQDGAIVGRTIDEIAEGNSVEQVAIPLRYLSGLFDYDQPLPPQLMSGLRIELTINRENAKVFQCANDEPATALDQTSAGYTISNR